MHDKLMELIAWYRSTLEGGGYPLVILLMAIESSFVPLPSELVIPFAAYYAHSQGHMSLPGVVIAGAIGSWIGASVMYWASRWAGRPLVLKVSTATDHWASRVLAGWPLLLRFVRHLFVTPEKIVLAEQWSAQYGSFGTFASRMIPVVRHLIGIPAGIVRLNYLTYSLYTVLGSGIWCAVLAWVGVQAGQDEALMRGEMKQITLWAVGGLAVLGVIYWTFVHRKLKSVAR